MFQDKSGGRYTNPAELVVHLASQWQNFELSAGKTDADEAVRDIMLQLGETIRSTLDTAGVALDAVALFNIVLGTELAAVVPILYRASPLSDGESDADAERNLLVGALASQANVFFTNGA